MNSLSAQKKALVRELITFTSAPEKVAIACLNATQWNVEQAADYFFDTYMDTTGGTARGAAPQQVNNEGISKLYSAYKDVTDDEISVDGILKLMEELKLAEDDIRLLLLAWKCGCKKQGTITRDEWKAGMKALRADSLPSLSAGLDRAVEELSDPNAFKNLYQFTFTFAKPNEQARVIDLATAVAYWNLLLKGRFTHLDDWLTFIQEHHKKAVQRDTWNLLLDFSRTVKDDLSDYDADGAWPVLIDEYVDYYRNKSKN